MLTETLARARAFAVCLVVAVASTATGVIADAQPAFARGGGGGGGGGDSGDTSGPSGCPTCPVTVYMPPNYTPPAVKPPEPPAVTGICELVETFDRHGTVVRRDCRKS